MKDRNREIAAAASDIYAILGCRLFTIEEGERVLEAVKNKITKPYLAAQKCKRIGNRKIAAYAMADMAAKLLAKTAAAGQ